MQDLLLPTTSESETRFRELPLLEIEFLYTVGVVTLASVERAKIINDYLVLSKRIRRKEMIYFKLSEKHFKSFYTVRNIILTYLRNV